MSKTGHGDPKAKIVERLKGAEHQPDVDQEIELAKLDAAQQRTSDIEALVKRASEAPAEVGATRPSKNKST